MFHKVTDNKENHIRFTSTDCGDEKICSVPRSLRMLIKSEIQPAINKQGDVYINEGQNDVVVICVVDGSMYYKDSNDNTTTNEWISKKLLQALNEGLVLKR